MRGHVVEGNVGINMIIVHCAYVPQILQHKKKFKCIYYTSGPINHDIVRQKLLFSHEKQKNEKHAIKRIM